MRAQQVCQNGQQFTPLSLEPPTSQNEKSIFQSLMFCKISHNSIPMSNMKHKVHQDKASYQTRWIVHLTQS